MKNIYPLLVMLSISATFYGGNKVSEKPVSCTNVTDIDGNVYTTVKIGTQCWMQQNLKTTRYRDGSPIGEVEDSVRWANIQFATSHQAAWCYYVENPAYNTTYGKLYNFYAVTDLRGLCPAGWHVPSDSEYIVLDDYLGGSMVAAGHMKAISNLWTHPNTGADNHSGFTALPAGYRFFNGKFSMIRYDCYFWSSTSGGNLGAWGRSLYNNYSSGYRNGYVKGNGFSVRCVKD